MKVIKEEQKKKKPVKGWFVNMNAGDPEINAEKFNDAMGTGDNAVSFSESWLTEDKANKYKIVYVRRSDDRTAIGYIDAYSEKQAAFLFKKHNRDVFRIVAIDCVEDHSKDDGEQISMFNEEKLNESVNEGIKKEFKILSGVDLIRKGVATHHLLYDPEVVIFIDASAFGKNVIQNGNFIHNMLHFIQRTGNQVSVSNIDNVKFYFYNRETKEYEVDINLGRVITLSKQYGCVDTDLTVKEN